MSFKVMTVDQLITKLSDFPGNLEVVIVDTIGDNSTRDKIHVDTKVSLLGRKDRIALFARQILAVGIN